MRYYDTIETPLTGKIFLKDGANRIVETNPIVKVWFQPIDTIRFDRIFDAKGLPILKEYALDSEGNRYAHYEATATDGVFKPDTVAIGVDSMKQAVEDIENAIYKLLNDTALSFGFKGSSPMDRASGYLVSKKAKYNAYAVTLTDWRDNIFDYVEAQEIEIGLGNRTMPTVAELLVELETNFPTPVKA